uniref:Uncharacterized protein n=1 Tax=Trepomonas sp. PC1 TaxID=1076344 RepID=A0A146KIQ1_9EUKA|eukprot:JAP96590.1 Hypothetical protein TPC1_10020 [Trepomonas sp. PC1]
MKLNKQVSIRHNFKLNIPHTIELLDIYKLSVQHGQFSRKVVCEATNIQPQVAEGRWYGEQRRTAKYGNGHDWKTMLSATVAEQIQQGNKCTAQIDEIRSVLMVPDIQISRIYDILNKSTGQLDTVKSTMHQTEVPTEFDIMDNFLELFE